MTALRKEAPKNSQTFDPHGSAHAHALAGAPLATFRQRAVAILLDFAVIALIWLPLKMGIQYFLQEKLHLREELYHVTNGHTTTSVKFDLERTLELGWTVCLVLYFGIFVRATNGFTPGKRLVGIRVASLSHHRITRWQAVERALGYGASALEGGFGFIQYFLYKNHLCVHDRIAETIVVQEARKKRAAR